MDEVAIDGLRVDFSSSSTDGFRIAKEQAKKAFDEYGCFLARKIFTGTDLDPIRHDIQHLIQMRMRYGGLQKQSEPLPSLAFDEGFMQLNKMSRAHGGVIYNACRRLIPVQRLSAHPKLTALSKFLMSAEFLIGDSLNTVRIDQPNEDTYLFPWHQDYPYIQDSEDGVVYWIPLQDVNQSNGWLRCAIGSHKQGVAPVRMVGSGNETDSRARNLELADPSLPDKYPQVSVPVNAGDALVFSTLLLHRSQPNTNDRARWTIQIRHGNFEHPKAVSKGWPGPIHHGFHFDQTHPEFVSNIDELRSV